MSHLKICPDVAFFRLTPRACLGVFLLLFFSTTGLAQIGLLPKGVGIINYTTRGYYSQTDQYGHAMNSRTGLGHHFDARFTGETMMAGLNGPELKLLAETLQRYDQTSSTGGPALLDAIDLGTMHGDVTANVKAEIFSLAYGVAPWLTVFAAVPRVTLETKTTLRFVRDPGGSADAIRTSLGDFAYQDLQDGLQRAANMGVADVQQNFDSLKYEPVDQWSNRAMGDLRVGAQTASGAAGPEEFGGAGFYRALVMLPTGRQDNPEAFTDIPTGLGYRGINFNTQQVFKHESRIYAGGSLEYQYNLDAKVRRRIPVGEERAIDPERTRDVKINPGDDVDVALMAGYAGDLVNASLRVGDKRHYNDKYSGSLEGNYIQLGEESDTRLGYAQVGLGFTTANLFKRGKFVYPMMVDIGYNHPLYGIHATDERFYSVAITGFFGSAPTGGRDSGNQPIAPGSSALSNETKASSPARPLKR